MLQKSKPEEQRFTTLNKKDPLHANESSYENETERREFDPNATRKKSKRDQISVDSMIALYILKPSTIPSIKDIGNFFILF